MHNTTHHPHIHLFVFSDNPKAGKLTVQGINKMKQEFSKEIFAEERLHIYEHKTEMRDELKRKIDSILSGIENHESDQFSKKELDALCGRLLHLSHDIELKTGKHKYGYLKKDKNINNQINGIMSELAKAPTIQELYGLYCEDHKDLQRMYRNDPKGITPIIENEEFKSIKNKIIQEAEKLGKARPDFEPVVENAPELADAMETNHDVPHNADPVYDVEYTVNLDTKGYDDSSSLLSDEESLFASVPDERPDNEFPEEYDQPAEWEPSEDYEQKPTVIANEKSHKSAPPEDNFEQCLDKAMRGDNESRYNLARMYFYGKGVEQDYDQARMWYGLAAAQGNSFASYELGKMYLYGIGINQDLELGKEYCYDAYCDFRTSVYDIYGYDVAQDVDDGKIDDIPGNKKAAYLTFLSVPAKTVNAIPPRKRLLLIAASVSPLLHGQYGNCVWQI